MEDYFISLVIYQLSDTESGIMYLRTFIHAEILFIKVRAFLVTPRPLLTKLVEDYFGSLAIDRLSDTPRDIAYLSTSTYAEILFIKVSISC